MTDGQLVPTEALGGDVQKFDDKIFDSVAKVGDYLPRIQLMSSNSALCKKGEFPVNHYALIQDKNHDDLGPDVDILVIAWRPKAMEIAEQVLAIYDTENQEFTRIAEKSEEQDSGCMYGPEFLIYIASRQKFATFFMGSKSARRESPNLKAQMHKAATLKSRLIETKKYTWQSPQITPCTTPFDIPETDEIKEKLKKFNNPPVTEVEVVEEDTEARAR